VTKKLLALALATLCAAPVLAGSASSARADVRVHVGGRVVVRTHVRVPRVVVVTRPARPRLHIHGHIYVGGGVVFAEPPPPPPPPDYDCAVPSYPVYSPPPPVVVGPPVDPRPFGPRLGVGVFAGSTRIEGVDTGDVGLAARLRLTRGLSLDGELAKNRDDAGNEARRAGLGVSWDLAPYSRLSPHLLGMMGRWDQDNYAEVGAGLTYRLSDSLALSADLRAGARENTAGRTPDGAIRASSPTSSNSNDPTRYTSGRVGLMLYF